MAFTCTVLHILNKELYIISFLTLNHCIEYSVHANCSLSQRALNSALSRTALSSTQHYLLDSTKLNSAVHYPRQRSTQLSIIPGIARIKLSTMPVSAEFNLALSRTVLSYSGKRWVYSIIDSAEFFYHVSCPHLPQCSTSILYLSTLQPRHLHIEKLET